MMKISLNFILNNPIEKFIEYWMDLDIFSTQKRFSNQKLDEIKKSKLSNNKIGLANSLKGFSTGKMPNYYSDLKTFLPETLLITGELDSKFTDINIEMASLLPNSTHEVIKNSGHNTHLEEPKKFIESVNRFLDAVLNSPIIYKSGHFVNCNSNFNRTSSSNLIKFGKSSIKCTPNKIKINFKISMYQMVSHAYYIFPRYL